MDGLFFNQSIKWILSELIRLQTTLSVQESTILVEAISVRWSAAIWEADDHKRLLFDGMELKDKVIGLIYFSELKCTVDQVRKWLEVKNITNFKNRVLIALDKANMIRFDQRNGLLHLLPPGIRYFEERFLEA